jgi:hypothetical protein
MDSAQVLEGLRRELQEENARCVDPDIGPRLDYAKWGEGFRVWAFGMDVPFTVLAREPVARQLVSLSIDGPDLGANGTCNWDLTEIANGDVTYPLLRHLRIARNAPDRHNRSIIARTYDEDGVLGRIAKKAPQLESLETPSAPSANFFEAELKNLTYLRVDAGFHTNNFVRELAQASFPPKLRGLEWGDYAERYMDDWRTKTTPFVDMEALVRCEGFGQITAFSLRNTAYADDELKQLKALRPGLSIRVVTSTHAYLR